MHIRIKAVENFINAPVQMHHLVFYLVVKIVCVCMCLFVYMCVRVAFGRAYFLCTWVVISTALPITEIYIKPEINFILFSLFNYADICCEAELCTWILITLCVCFFSSLQFPLNFGGKRLCWWCFYPPKTQRTVGGEKTWWVCVSPAFNSHCTVIIRAS